MKVVSVKPPSARYDAEGNAGMINIIFKENSDYGTNGSFSAAVGYGWYGKSRASLNLNHRTKKLSIFSDYSLSYSHNWYELGNNRTVVDMGVPTQTNSASNSPNTNVTHTPRLGFDYNLSSKTNISGIISGFSNKQETDALNTISIQEGSKLPTLINQNTLEKSNWRHGMGNLNARHALKEKHGISIDLDYLLYHNVSPAFYHIDYRYLESGENNLGKIKIDKTTPIRIGVTKADYTYSITNQTNLEAGAKYTITQLDNVVVVDRLLQEGWNRDTQFSQKIDMIEKIGATYANLNLQINTKITMQAGVRWEHTYTNINSPEQKNLVLRNYHNLFPSLFLSKELNKNNSLQFSYSRRITRPTYN